MLHRTRISYDGHPSNEGVELIYIENHLRLLLYWLAQSGEGPRKTVRRCRDDLARFLRVHAAWYSASFQTRTAGILRYLAEEAEKNDEWRDHNVALFADRIGITMPGLEELYSPTAEYIPRIARRPQRRPRSS